MEEDALRVMKFMASNGLCANPKKTALLFLNHKFNHEEKILLKVGKENVEQVQNAKLLGMIFDSNQKWTEHIYGTGGLIPSLNQKLFFIRRLKNSVGQAALLKISHGLFISKLRYGLQMLGSVRWSDTDPLNNELESLQKCLNKVLRTLNGTKISDQVSTKSLLSKFKILSVNQMNAQIKLTEMWKSVHIDNYPIKTHQIECIEGERNTRLRSLGQLKEDKITFRSGKTFTNDAIHIWNKAPSSIKNCTTINSVKTAIKSFVVNLPI